MSIESDDNFIYEDGLGHLFDRKGRKLMTLHVDNVGAPLESCMTFRDFKMLTKNCKEKSKKEAKSHNQHSLMDIDQIQTESKRKCIRYSFEIKQKFHEMTWKKDSRLIWLQIFLGFLSKQLILGKEKPTSSNIASCSVFQLVLESLVGSLS